MKAHLVKIGIIVSAILISLGAIAVLMPGKAIGSAARPLPPELLRAGATTTEGGQAAFRAQGAPKGWCSSCGGLCIGLL